MSEFSSDKRESANKATMIQSASSSGSEIQLPSTGENTPPLAAFSQSNSTLNTRAESSDPITLTPPVGLLGDARGAASLDREIREEGAADFNPRLLIEEDASRRVHAFLAAICNERAELKQKVEEFLARHRASGIDQEGLDDKVHEFLKRHHAGLGVEPEEAQRRIDAFFNRHRHIGEGRLSSQSQQSETQSESEGSIASRIADDVASWFAPSVDSYVPGPGSEPDSSPDGTASGPASVAANRQSVGSLSLNKSVNNEQVLRAYKKGPYIRLSNEGVNRIRNMADLCEMSGADLGRYIKDTSHEYVPREHESSGDFSRSSSGPETVAYEFEEFIKCHNEPPFVLTFSDTSPSQHQQPESNQPERNAVSEGGERLTDNELSASDATRRAHSAPIWTRNPNWDPELYLSEDSHRIAFLDFLARRS